MNRISSTAIANSAPVADQDMSSTVAANAGDVLDAASDVPDLSLCRQSKAYSDRKLERLGRRFGFPDTFLGSPLINVTTCFERAEFYIEQKRFVSAKKVLEIGLNNAVTKQEGDIDLIKDMISFINRLITLDNGALSLGFNALRVGDGFSSSSEFYMRYAHSDFDNHRAPVFEVDLFARGFALEDDINALKKEMAAKYSRYEGLESLKFGNLFALNTAIQKQLDRDLEMVRSFLGNYFPGYSR